MIPFRAALFAHSALTAPGGGGGGNINGYPVSNRWRMWITAKQGASNWPGVGEIEVRLAAGGPDQCEGGVATASGNSASAIASFDNDQNTRWAQGDFNMPAWIEYQFAAPVAITELVVKSANANVDDNPTDFQLQYYDAVRGWVSRGRFVPGNWSTSQTRIFDASQIIVEKEPSLTGEWADGGTITIVDLVSPSTATASYVWKLNGVVVPGVEGNSYTGTATDNLKTLSVDITYSLAGQANVTRTVSRKLRSVGVSSNRWRLQSVGTSYFAVGEIEMRRTPGGADQCNGGTVAASSELNGSVPASKAFDNDPNTTYHSGDGGDGNYLEYQFPAPVAVNEVNIWTRNDDTQMWTPTQIRVLYYDGANWIEKMRFNVAGWSRNTNWTYDTSVD